MDPTRGLELQDNENAILSLLLHVVLTCSTQFDLTLCTSLMIDASSETTLWETWRLSSVCVQVKPVKTWDSAQFQKFILTVKL